MATSRFSSVWRDGELVGRTTAHRHARLDERLGAPHLLFGFTEFVDDDAVFDALVTELDRRAREHAERRTSSAR